MRAIHAADRIADVIAQEIDAAGFDVVHNEHPTAVGGDTYVLTAEQIGLNKAEIVFGNRNHAVEITIVGDDDNGARVTEWNMLTPATDWSWFSQTLVTAFVRCGVKIEFNTK